MGQDLPADQRARTQLRCLGHPRSRQRQPGPDTDHQGLGGHSGKSHEKIFNVAWSGERSIDATGQLPAVGNTVDVATATYTNSIGAEQLSTVWTDPEFDPTQEAFYYARVIEIPTPRWTTFDALHWASPHPSPPACRNGR